MWVHFIYSILYFHFLIIQNFAILIKSCIFIDTTSVLSLQNYAIFDTEKLFFRKRNSSIRKKL
jgi:hypothetical protein